jgi:hypothetical protein
MLVPGTFVACNTTQMLRCTVGTLPAALRCTMPRCSALQQSVLQVLGVAKLLHLVSRFRQFVTICNNPCIAAQHDISWNRGARIIHPATQTNALSQFGQRKGFRQKNEHFLSNSLVKQWRNNMLFTAQSFIMSVSASADVKKAGGGISVRINLTESEIPDSQVMATLMSGQSPRVRLQGALREDGVPKDRTVNLSWEKYLGTAKLSLGIIPETPEQILARAKADPMFLKQLMEQFKIGVSDGIAQEGQNPEDDGTGN